MADNTVTLVGNLTRDPELRFTNGGRAVTTFGLAVNRRWQQSGEWQEQTSFFNVVAWGQLAENAASSLVRGSRVIVNGRLEQRQYETQDGEKRNVTEVVADEVGPSLRWATAQIEKTNRSSEGGGGGSGSPSGAGGSPAGRAAPDPYYGDEEPF
jgi:single-strand DNA-binding protein